MNKSILLAVFACSICCGQNFPEAPKPHVMRETLFSNGAMYAATFLAATSTSHGSHACFLEEPTMFGKLPSGENIGLAHPYRTYYKRALPINAAITAFSIWRARHGRSSDHILDTATGFHLGIAAVQYSAGCF